MPTDRGDDIAEEGDKAIYARTRMTVDPYAELRADANPSLIRGNALTVPLADDSVDLVVTSPPYFALRSYTDACGTCGGISPTAGTPITGGTAKSTLKHDGRKNPNPLGPQTYKIEKEPDPNCPECEGSGRGHYAGQIGSEPTPAAFIDALVSVTRECVRVLKPSGSLFVNLGDSYSRGARPVAQPQQSFHADRPRKLVTSAGTGQGKTQNGIPAKSLQGLPWRYALRCIDDLGLILRAEIIWSKPNGLPESVQDRVRRSHEQFFHFTKEPRYYSAVDDIREAQLTNVPDNNNGMISPPNPLGKLPGSVWVVPTEPLQVPDHLPQHFAAFPSEWPRRIILGWSPSGICCECGEGRRPVVDKERDRASAPCSTHGDQQTASLVNGGPFGNRGETTAIITGESCACPTPTAPTRPAVVLDPFAGTGTTVAVANHLGRYGVGIDLSADYLRLARWRCQDPGLRAKVLGVDKPAAEVPGQMTLLS